MKDALAANATADASGSHVPLTVEVPGEDHHKGLISCQAACPVHTDARGYVRAAFPRGLDGGDLTTRLCRRAALTLLL